MFNRSKRPVLTATTCDEMENLRLAIEVLTGQYARFVEVDFNTGKGKVRIGSTVFDLCFHSERDRLVHFKYHHLDGWNTARFDEPGEVRVINQAKPRKSKNGEHSMWCVGRSATDRWEEPLYLRGVEYAAQARGLSVDEYLGRKEV